MTATTLEFETRPNDDGTLPVPAEIAVQLKGIERVRVLILLQPSNEAKEWAALTSAQFLQGYADSDSIYDQLSTR